MNTFFNLRMYCVAYFSHFCVIKTAIRLTYFFHQLRRNLLIVIHLRQVEPLRLCYIIIFDITEEKCDIVYQDLNRTAGSDL
jgi:hypothetical protein